MKIAIVGGGIFGVTTAVYLARAGYEVDLFEKEHDILRVASGINQFRIHRGHHYPRSAETTLSSLRTEALFRAEYPEAVIDNAEHYYCVAKEGSLVSAEQYMDFCRKYGLEFVIAKPDFIDHHNAELCVKVKEYLVDPDKLRASAWQKLKESGVRVLLNTEAMPEALVSYDKVVIATYAVLNSLLHHAPHAQRDYQFKIIEKPVLKVSAVLQDKSIVVVDGSFTCLDPYGATGFSLLGNVIHATHQSNIGKHPIVDDRLRPYLNKGVIAHPAITNIKLFLESAARFFPAIADAEHVGSMYTIRTTLPYQEKTDTRPTVVETADHRTITIFSGKISNCVEAAQKVLDIVRDRNIYEI